MMSNVKWETSEYYLILCLFIGMKKNKKRDAAYSHVSINNDHFHVLSNNFFLIVVEFFLDAIEDLFYFFNLISSESV